MSTLVGKLGGKAALVAALVVISAGLPSGSSTLRAHESKSPAARTDSSPSAATPAPARDSVLEHFGRAEYLHTLLNPVPVYGLSMGLLALGAGLAWRSRRTVVVGLGIVAFSGLAAWPTYALGQQAYERVRAMSDTAGGLWLDEHMARAEKLISVFYVLAALALAGIAAPLKWPRTALPLALGTVAVGVGAMGVGGWIAYAGGHVRHPEFRFEPPPPRKAGHGHGGMDHAKPDAPDGSPPAGGMTGMDVPANDGRQPSAVATPMDQANVDGPAGEKAPPRSAEVLQLEASRLQLEASRLQLEASRKALEKKGQTPAPEGSEAGPSPQPTPAETRPHPH